MNRFLAISLITAAALGACKRQPASTAMSTAPTCASVDVMHAGVTLVEASNVTRTPYTAARVENGGRVRTSADGRAMIRTDEGLELRLAGDSEVRFVDAHPRIERGRVFVRAWGDDERTLTVGDQLTLGVGEAAIEIERAVDGTTRVIDVRGEIAWRTGSAQGRLERGESLEGHGALAVQPASVWDDWTGGAASPQGEMAREARGTALAYLHGETGEAPMALAINDHRVTVRVEGDVATTTVSQRFFNGSERVAPVEYRIRLPDDALVSDFVVERDGGSLQARPATVASLNESGGGFPALMAHPDGGLFARLTPLAPGQTVRCELRYVQWLRHDEGRRAYVYPMGDAESPPFVGEFHFELSAVRAGVGVLRGPIGSRVDGTTLRFARSDYRPRGDFAVDLFDQHAPAAASARVWRSSSAGVDSDPVLVDLTLPPATSAGSDLVLLVDDSAGIDSGSLAIARAAVDAIVHAAGPGDRVALMFGDLRGRAAEGTAGELTPVSDARRQAILDSLARIHPGGGSNLGAMIADAYARLDPRRNGAVVYLGDAMPTIGALDPERLVDTTLRVAPDLRLYVLALGDEAHPDVLERLTRRGGLTLRAGDGAEAVREAHRLVAHATRATLRDVTVQLDGVLEHAYPERIEQWVAGDPLQIVGDRVGEIPTTLRVSARTPSGVQTWTVPVGIDAVQDTGDIRRRIGMARLRSLDAVGASRAALADLGVRFGLITPTSAFVLGAPIDNASEGSTQYELAGSLWPQLGLTTRLPRLGVEGDIAPRGIRMLGEANEYPLIADEESGWYPHWDDEDYGLHGMLSIALGAADLAADACVDRARSIRPSITGSVTADAVIAADGHVTNATVRNSSLHDLSAESCIRRAVAGLSLPPPSAFGDAPGTATHTFTFAPQWDAQRGRACAPTARLTRGARMVLWRERIAARPGQAGDLWNDAGWRCELRSWDDRAALLALMASAVSDPSELLSVRSTLDKDGQRFLDRLVARRFGPTRLWRTWMGSLARINWGVLIRQLASPTVPIERKIELAQAYRTLAPWDIDVRLRLMSLFEQAGRMREARRVADELRGDPFADARVRARVGEMLIRAGDRDEGLRALTEMAEFAPYDPRVRARLGDLLLTYGRDRWADEAYAQCQTLSALRPGDANARVRMALAALAAHREDEGLRTLRQVAEDAHDDDSAPAVESLLVREVAALIAQRPDDGAVQAWLRVARLTDAARTGALLARWTHPEVSVAIDAMQIGDSAFVPVGREGDVLPMRVFAPGTALEGSRVRIRGVSGLEGARTADVHVTLVIPGEGAPRVVERDVTLRADAATMVLAVQNGALVEVQGAQ